VGTDHRREVQAHSATQEELERFRRLQSTAVSATMQYMDEVHALEDEIRAIQAALVLALEARDDAQAFSMQWF
jgi:hypothetical protein